jgi:DNA-binding GntR family transcriptional regulator
MDTKRTQSIADSVFLALENDILSGALKKGDLITELKACEQFGVSRTPVREALQRLRQEGLVEESGKGAIVIGITEADIDDIYEVRIRIEGLAAARCAERISAEEQKRLSDSVALQEFYAERGAADSLRNLDSEFHRLIFSYCGSRTMETLLLELHRKVKLVRRVSVENPTRAREAVSEHRAILEAIAARDAGQAEALMAQHIRNAKHNIDKTNGKGRE